MITSARDLEFSLRNEVIRDREGYKDFYTCNNL